jgi:hypothetical protein
MVSMVSMVLVAVSQERTLDFTIPVVTICGLGCKRIKTEDSIRIHKIHLICQSVAYGMMMDDVGCPDTLSADLAQNAQTSKMFFPSVIATGCNCSFSAAADLAGCPGGIRRRMPYSRE